MCPAGKIPVVEDFNNPPGGTVATVNFSVPAEIREAFDAAFAGQNKSAVIAQLMARAVEERARQNRRAELYQDLTASRPKRPSVTSAKLSAARRKRRP
jgi:hypothetical protein